MDRRHTWRKERQGPKFDRYAAGRAPEGCHREIYEKLGIDWKKLPTKRITAAMKSPATL
jgi:hypothetical protein